MTPTTALVHQRLGTLAKAYVKHYHLDVYNTLLKKAESEYANRQYRRTTKDDLDSALADLQHGGPLTKI